MTVQEIFPSPFDYAGALPARCARRRARSARGRGGATMRPSPRWCTTWPGRVTAGSSSCSLPTPRSGGWRRWCARSSATRFPILVQGEGQRDHLLRRFREAGNAILLGTDSFWEGVDVPGRALRGLVHRQATFQGSLGAADGGPAGATVGAGRGRLLRLSPAARGAQAEAGIRPADSRGAGRRRGGPARPPGR